MNLLLLEADTSGDAPCPQLQIHNAPHERGQFYMGVPELAARLSSNFYCEAFDGNRPGLADFMQGIGFVLVSQRFKSVLESMGSDIEFVPIVVRHQEMARAGYFLANPRRVVHGADLQASIMEISSVGVAISVDKLVLSAHAFEGSPVAYMVETDHFVVHPHIKEALVAAGCVGCAFVPPEFVHF